MQKKPFVTLSQVEEMAKSYPTPFHLYDEKAIRENARLTQERIDPAEAELASLDRRFRLLLEHLGEQPEVRLTRFRPDERKSGGVYETVSGIVKQIDLIARRIRLLDGTDIPMDDVLTLDGALFDVLD